MKKITFLLIIAGIFFAACFKPEVAPNFVYDGEANMTIADLKTFHELGAGSQPTLIDSAIIVSGIVTSTDQYGSCYKELFFQDSTGGISMLISTNPYYMKYRIGQRIFVKVQGLYLGNYTSGNNFGYYRLGLYGNENGGLQHISLNLENKHIIRSGAPEKELISNPKVITKVEDVLDSDYHTLVKLVNCYFKEAKGGAKYYEERLVIGGAASQPIRFNDADTKEIIARISSPAYCSFANEVMPEGTVNITGLLTKFGDTRQFIIRSIDDVQIPPPAKILQVYDMSADPFSQGWKNKQVTGSDVWTYAAGKYVRIQPTSGNETECWLVSPKFNFTGEKNVTLSFTYRLIGDTRENVQVLYTIDGKDWKPLPFTVQDGAAAEAMMRLDDSVATNPNLQIAFRYKTTDLFPTWYIMNIAFKAASSN